MQRKKERKAGRRKWYRKNKARFYRIFGESMGAKFYSAWKRHGGFWPLRMGIIHKIFNVAKGG
jgi:hypothetical protein